MKKVAPFLIFSLLVSGCMKLYYHGKEEAIKSVMIHESIGDTLDQEEAGKYGWFEDIIGFEYAVFYETKYGEFLIQIQAYEEQFISRNSNKGTIKILYDFVEKNAVYEGSIQLFERKWGIIDYDVLRMPITKDELRATKTCCLAGCGLGSGVLGYLPSIFLCMYVAGADYDFRNAENMVWGWIAFAGAEVIFISIGATTGNYIGHRLALRAIKKSRKPKKSQ